jgi:structural maintenance of chromosomes protein 6
LCCEHFIFGKKMSERPARSSAKRSYDLESDSGAESDVQNARKKSSLKAADNSAQMDEESDEEIFCGRRIQSEAGQIMKVELKNFMCHRNFSQTFGKHMNFITGRNGSGT